MQSQNTDNAVAAFAENEYLGVKADVSGMRIWWNQTLWARILQDKCYLDNLYIDPGGKIMDFHCRLNLFLFIEVLSFPPEDSGKNYAPAIFTKCDWELGTAIAHNTDITHGQSSHPYLYVIYCYQK